MAYAGFDPDAPSSSAQDGVGNHGRAMRRRKGGLDDEQFRVAVKGAILDAVDYTDGFVADLRAKATQYYRGEPLGNEEEGRSQVVMTELRDVVQGILPGLLRLFVSGENAVEFVPTNANTVDLAEQQTDYINHIFFQDNPGFLNLFSAFKDALVRKTGVLKWYWCEDEQHTATDFTGLTAEQVAVLRTDRTVDQAAIEIEPGEPIQMPPVPDPQTGQMVPPPPIPTYNVHIERTIPKGQVVIEALPPEEFLIARDARRPATASYAGHRALKTVSELVALGYDRAVIEENMGASEVFALNYEAQVRNPAVMSDMAHAQSTDPTQQKVLYVESYLRIDRDGDGIAELWKVCTLGEAHYVLHAEEVDHIPFCVLCPDPEPHMVIGQSIADQTMDLQQLKTGVVRGILDSLAESIHPRTVVVENQVNIDDALNTEIGAIIRARAPGMVQEFSKTFVGQQALPLVAYLDDVRSQRTGVSQASQGLDPDVLQSTTKSAVDNTVAKSQERIELIGRIFAETGMTDLFKGVLKLVCRYQDRARVVKLRGKWVEVDPRSWDADLQVHVNVAVGHGSAQDRMQFLMLVLQKQEQIIQLLGPANPLCTLQQYRYTLGKILNLAGIKDDVRYFGQIGPQEIAQLAQSSQNRPDPQMALVQVEQQRAAADAQLKMLKFQSEQAAQLREDARKQSESLVNAALQLAEIEAKYGVQGQNENLTALLTHIGNLVDTQSRLASDLHGNVTKAHATMHGNTLDAATQRHNNMLQAETQRQIGASAPAESA